MKLEDIIKQISKTRNGTFRSVKTRRFIKLKSGAIAEKESLFQVQNNIEYGNRATVQRQTSCPIWAKAVYISGIKFWQNKNTGEHYLPLNISGKVVSRWSLNGKRIRVEDIEDNLPAKEKQKRPTAEELAEKNQAQFVICKIDTVISIK